jgi:hypothetical protein
LVVSISPGRVASPGCPKNEEEENLNWIERGGPLIENKPLGKIVPKNGKPVKRD